MNVKCRAFALAQFSSGQSIVSKKFKLIAQLTLFPSGDNESPKNSRITVNLYG